MQRLVCSCMSVAYGEAEGLSLTVQLMPLQMLGPRIQLVASGMLAGESARCSFAAGALVASRTTGALVLRRRGPLHGGVSLLVKQYSGISGGSAH